MTLTKAHIVDRLMAQNLFTRIESTRIIDSVLEIMKKTLEDGEDVLISGFGRFRVNRKASRRGRNPHTGKAIELPAKSVITFKYSTVLAQKMNNRNVSD